MIGKIPPLHITQHKRFVPYGTHQNFCFAKTSFMLGTLVAICPLATKRKTERKPSPSPFGTDSFATQEMIRLIKLNRNQLLGDTYDIKIPE